MSGEDLRHAAKQNLIDRMRDLCRFKSNPCSTDDIGLTALHYAVWNGNLECVKYLVMNPRGVTRKRERISCINIQSVLGYTGEN
jgi:ankyrin repeat protein